MMDDVPLPAPVAASPLACSEAAGDGSVQGDGHVLNQRFTATVDYQTFSGKDHYEENAAAEKDVLEWMQARLGGLPAPSTC